MYIYTPVKEAILQVKKEKKRGAYSRHAIVKCLTRSNLLLSLFFTFTKFNELIFFFELVNELI